MSVYSWRLSYFKHSDFVSGRTPVPLDNVRDEVHTGLTEIDVLFEPSFNDDPGFSYTCRVDYADGTEATWQFRNKRRVHLKLADQVRDWDYRKAYGIVARQDTDVPLAWHPKTIQGKTFWNLFGRNWGREIRRHREGKSVERVDITSSGFADSDLLKKAGNRLFSISMFFPLQRANKSPANLKGVVPNLKHISFREIKVFDSDGKDISRQAILYGESEGGGFTGLKTLTDGDTTGKTVCISKYPTINRPHVGWIQFGFLDPRSISKVTLHHGQVNAFSTVSKARDFVLQALVAGKWTDIPGTRIKGNEKETTVHTFDPVTTSRLRVRVEDQTDLYDYRTYCHSIDHTFARRDALEQEIDSPDKPFLWWYIGRNSIFSVMPTTPEVDLAGYRKWRERHPNFMGFVLPEWDSDVHKLMLPWRLSDGFGKMVDGKLIPTTYLRTSGNQVVERAVPERPKTRREAVEQLERAFKYQKRILFDDVIAQFSQSIWHHYGLEWGGNAVHMEHGGGGAPNRQLSFAAARGASRQYDKPWGVYNSYYLFGNLSGWTSDPYLTGPRYVHDARRGLYKDAHTGVSANLNRREMFFAFLSGCNFNTYEHEHEVPFVDADGDGVWEYSDYGKNIKEVFGFYQAHPDRGAPYTPIGLLLDYTHGWRHQEERKIFYGTIPPKDGDRMIDAFFFSAFPWDSVSREGYGHGMTNSPYGDIFDVLVPNPPSGVVSGNVLGNYKVQILLGNINQSPALVTRLADYVAQGGTLVVNATQVAEHFPDGFFGVRLSDQVLEGTASRSLLYDRVVNPGAMRFRYSRGEATSAETILTTPDGQPLITKNRYGKGNVILTLQHHMVGQDVKGRGDRGEQKLALPSVAYLMSLLSHETVPVRVTGGAGCMVSKHEDRWWVALFHNHGYHKEVSKPAVFHEDGAARVTLYFKGKAMGVRELVAGEDVPWTSQAGETVCRRTMAPGTFQVLEITPR